MSRSHKDSNQANGYRARFFVVVMLFSLFICALGLGLGERIVHDERAASVHEVNVANVRSLAVEFRAAMDAAAGRLRALGHLNPEELAEKIRADADLVSVTIYAPTSRADYWEPRVSVLNADFSKLYAFTPKRLEKLRRAIPVPFARVVAEREWMASAAADAEAPLATLAVALDDDSVAVADLRTERWAKRVAPDGSARVLYLVDSRGNAIAHPELKTYSRAFAAAGAPPLIAENPLVKEALTTDVSEPLARVFDWDGRRWLGAAADTGFAGVRAITQISDRAAFVGVMRLRQHAGLLALLGLTLAAFGAAWLVRGSSLAAVPASAAIPTTAESRAAHAVIADEFLSLLMGVRSRIDQIRARAMQPLGSTPHDPEPLRETLEECGQRLESLGEQAAWAAEIFRKLRKVGLEPERPPESSPEESSPESSNEANSADR